MEQEYYQTHFAQEYMNRSIDEIAGNFESLPNYVDDPPILATSNSVMSKRWYLTQGADPIVCRHMQIKLDLAAEAYKNELYTMSVFGSLLLRE